MQSYYVDLGILALIVAIFTIKVRSMSNSIDYIKNKYIDDLKSEVSELENKLKKVCSHNFTYINSDINEPLLKRSFKKCKLCDLEEIISQKEYLEGKIKELEEEGNALKEKQENIKIKLEHKLDEIKKGKEDG